MYNDFISCFSPTKRAYILLNDTKTLLNLYWILGTIKVEIIQSETLLNNIATFPC